MKTEITLPSGGYHTITVRVPHPTDDSAAPIVLHVTQHLYGVEVTRDDTHRTPLVRVYWDGGTRYR